MSDVKFFGERSMRSLPTMKFVPNAITIARILLTPVLLVMLMSDTLFGQVGAFVLFVVAAISDYYDGKLARQYKAKSRLGQFLDPFADKVLVLGTFVALSFLIPHIVPWWAVALIALRDVAVTVLRTWAEARGRTLRTLPMAKTKTTLQLVFLIGILLLLAASRPEMPVALTEGARWVLDSILPFLLLMVVVALTVFTGLFYLFQKEYVSRSSFNG